MQDIVITKKQASYVMVSLLLSAFFLRLIISVSYQNDYDLLNFYKPWALAMEQYPFTIYEKAKEGLVNLDYPPLYLLPLFLLGKLYRYIPALSSYAPYDMLLLKFFPVLFDALTILCFYRIGRRFSEFAGIAAAALWAVNPSVIFNSSFWGQTDSILIFLLLVSFALIEFNRPLAGSFVFALAGLTKYQALFFLPILLLELFFKFGPKKAFKGIGVAAGAVAGVFLPFMLGAGDVLLPLHVYFGGAGKYPFVSLNAANLFSALGMNGFPESTPILGGFTFSHLSLFFLFSSLTAVILIYIFGKRVSLWVTGFFLMQCIFMLTARMHERYQLVVLPFALMAYLTTKNKRFFHLFTALTLLTLLNQALILFGVTSSEMNGLSFPPGYVWTTPWISPEGISPDGIMMVLLSVVNSIVFVLSVAECFHYSFRKDEPLEAVSYSSEIQ